MAIGDRYGFGRTGSNQRVRGHTMIPHTPADKSQSRQNNSMVTKAVDRGRTEKVLGRFFVKDEISGRRDLEVIYVTSSNLVMVAYSYSRKMMRIRFKNGSEYNYWSVPPKVMEVMKRVGSKGRFHYYNIRKRYPYQRIR